MADENIKKLVQQVVITFYLLFQHRHANLQSRDNELEGII